jgi:hypothetical protein
MSSTANASAIIPTASPSAVVSVAPKSSRYSRSCNASAPAPSRPPSTPMPAKGARWRLPHAPARNRTLNLRIKSPRRGGNLAYDSQSRRVELSRVALRSVQSGTRFGTRRLRGCLCPRGSCTEASLSLLWLGTRERPPQDRRSVRRCRGCLARAAQGRRRRCSPCSSSASPAPPSALIYRFVTPCGAPATTSPGRCGGSRRAGATPSSSAGGSRRSCCEARLRRLRDRATRVRLEVSRHRVRSGRHHASRGQGPERHRRVAAGDRAP